MTEVTETESPAVEELEADRLAAIVPFVEQDQTRPDFLEPEPEDHPWVLALSADLAARIAQVVIPGAEEHCLDPTIMVMDPEAAWLTGYRTAIHRLREIANDQGMDISLVVLPTEVTEDA